MAGVHRCFLISRICLVSFVFYFRSNSPAYLYSLPVFLSLICIRPMISKSNRFAMLFTIPMNHIMVSGVLSASLIAEEAVESWYPSPFLCNNLYPPFRAEDGQKSPPLSPTPMHSYRDISITDGWIN